MSEYAPRMWQCNTCRRPLGVVVRDTSRRTRLVVLRHGVMIDSPAEWQRVIPAVILEAGVVTCGWCGAERTWSISEQSLDDLLERRRARTFGLVEVDDERK